MNEVVDSRLGERVYCGQLGGMDFCGVMRPGSRQKAALLRVDYGSVDLGWWDRDGVWRDAPSGTAHFLEHRIFEKADGDIADRFNGLGADINASTSYTSTVYSLACVDNFYANLELLVELAFEYGAVPGGIEREREIIGRELRLGSDDPEWMGYLHGLKALYGDVPLSWDIAGNAESLLRIDDSVLTDNHQAYYQPRNMGLYICGDFDLDQVVNRVEAALGACVRPHAGAGIADREVVLPAPRQNAMVRLPVRRPYVLHFYGDQEVGLAGGELLARELALELALDIAFGSASDFFAEHYGRGVMAGDAFGAEVYAEPTFCFCAVGGYGDRADMLGDAIAVALGRLDSLVESDFERAKRKAYGQLVRSCEQAEQIVDLLCSAAICKAKPFDYFEVYERISAADVRAAAARCLQPELMGAVHILPVDSAN